MVDQLNANLAIETDSLRKAYGDTVAVDGVDLAVPRGSIYGVLGPNGAGKTTTIRMLATLIRPDSGSAKVLGLDVVSQAKEVRKHISLTGQLASVDEELTGRENLILLGKLLGLGKNGSRARADELLEGFGLSEAGGKLVKHYSGGMRRRIDIAASIVITPELLFLDEPTTGLDPRSRNQVWEIVRALVGRGTTVLLCTQYLDEADQLAGRIAVIDTGRVIAEGTPAELKASVGGSVLHVDLKDGSDRERAEGILVGALGSEAIEVADHSAVAVPTPSADRAASAMAAISAGGIEVTGFSLGQPSLDEVFLALTGHSAGGDDESAETGEGQ